MEENKIEAIRAKIIKIVNECTDIQKLKDFNTILNYIINTPKEEYDLYVKLSKSKGFNAKLFAQRLREIAEVAA